MIRTLLAVYRGDRTPRKHALETEKDEILVECKELEARKEQILTQYKDSKNKFIASLANASVYIDSNIYMDERFTKLFDLLLNQNFDILLLEVQYQEIYRS
ncbi:MAG: hypothetical protein Q9N67_00020 [Ghiorsea sp.]|nr:hypothetical protein [Ghiorsea sp.]